LLRVGFTKPVRCRTAGALLPHLFTLTDGRTEGGMFSVALSVPCGPPSYGAHYPVEFGLSSPNDGSDHPPTHSADLPSIVPSGRGRLWNFTEDNPGVIDVHS